MFYALMRRGELVSDFFGPILRADPERLKRYRRPGDVVVVVRVDAVEVARGAARAQVA